MSDLRELIRAEAGRFAGVARDVNRAALKRGENIPTQEERQVVSDALFQLFDKIRAGTPPETDRQSLQNELRLAIAPLLFRSRPWWHSCCKPYGYAGDFMIIEQIYDLDTGAGEDPFQSCLANCLDFAFSQVPSSPAVQQRRWWLRDLLVRESERRDHRLRILDIACGGARYQHDYLSSLPSTRGVKLTLVDQDPAALKFASQHRMADYRDCLTVLNVRIADLRKRLPEEHWDVIVSAGLFDYLDEDTARNLATFLQSRLTEEGVLAISNFGRDGRNEFVLEYIGDWPLVWRTRDEVAAVMPREGSLQIHPSENNSLWMAEYRRS